MATTAKKTGAPLSVYKIKARITLTEELLGTKALEPEIHEAYIANQHPDGVAKMDEIKAANRKAEDAPEEEQEIKGVTVFHQDEDRDPILYDYQIKGFFKDACGGLRRASTSYSGALSAYKSVIDGAIFVNPRQIKLQIPEGGAMGLCSRPLRTETMRGPRVALCCSETVPAGTVMEVEISYYNKSYDKVIREWLDYGQVRGLGQWRNSGKGTFTWEEIQD